MQELSWLLTLALVALLAAVFLPVISQTKARASPAAAASGSRYRSILFWLLVIVGTGVSYATLARWPHGPAGGVTDAPLRVNAIAEQWSWSVDRTRLPLNKPIVFSVTSRDVNHGFGIYDPDLRLVTQIQAMPGYINNLHYTFTRPGKYRVLCLEYCGLIHHDMIVELTVSP